MTTYYSTAQIPGVGLMAIHAFDPPEGATLADCFPPEIAESYKPAGKAEPGWMWDPAAADGAGAFVPPPAAAPPTPAELADYAAARRFAVEAGGILVAGAPIATDRESQAMIGNAFAYVQASGAASVSYKTSAGFVTLTAEQIKAVALAVGAHVQACFAAEDAADAAINASPPTISTLAQVDAAFASLALAVQPA